MTGAFTTPPDISVLDEKKTIPLPWENKFAIGLFKHPKNTQQTN